MTAINFRIGAATRTVITTSKEDAKLIGRVNASYLGRDSEGRHRYVIQPDKEGYNWSDHNKDSQTVLPEKFFSRENHHLYLGAEAPQFRLTAAEKCEEKDGKFYVTMPLNMKAPARRSMAPRNSPSGEDRAPSQSPRKVGVKTEALPPEVERHPVIDDEPQPAPVPRPDRVNVERLRMALDSTGITDELLSAARVVICRALAEDEGLSVMVTPDGRGIRLTRDL